jgi:hypothetical protein
MMKRYTIKVKDPADWQEIHNTLCHQSHCECIPDRSVNCTDLKLHSSTRSTYELSEEEVELLKSNSKIEWVEISPTDHPDAYPKPQPVANRFLTDVKIYRDLQINGPPTLNPTSAEENRTGWQIKRVGIQTNSDVWSSTSPILSNVSYTATGENVDIVIQDSGILQYHPEFLRLDGTSRVRDIVLDGPYYIDPVYFDVNGFTILKPDGRTGISEESAKNWWASGANRSPEFANIGEFEIPSNYTEFNSLGNTLDGSNGMISGHGTAVAGLCAGKSFGLAFNANIWSMPMIADNVGVSVELGYDLIKVWHMNKPVNQITGIKNPTVINASWGYLASFYSNTTVNYKFRGTSGSFIGNSPVSNQVTAMKEGLYNTFGQGTYKSWSTSSRSSSTDTAANELMNEGVIFVAAAGNNNQRIGIGSDDPDRLNYMTDVLYGFDPRIEFPTGTVPCNHRDWLNPIGVGFDSQNDFHPVICVGAIDDEIVNSSERKTFYSNNGPGVDIWAPADETLTAGTHSGLGINPIYKSYPRYDNSNFYDCPFNGTSAASPVVAGLIALYMENNPSATSADVKNWLITRASVLVSSDEYLDETSNDTQTGYWTGQYNLRGAQRRIVYNPYTDSPTSLGIQIAPNKLIVYEGETLIVVINMDPGNDGTYYYTIESSPTSTIDPEDFESNTLSGSFSVTNGIGTLQFTLSDDAIEEGSEYFRVIIHETSVSGNIVAMTEYIEVVDQNLSQGTPLTGYQIPLRIYLKV